MVSIMGLNSKCKSSQSHTYSSVKGQIEKGNCFVKIPADDNN